MTYIDINILCLFLINFAFGVSGFVLLTTGYGFYKHRKRCMAMIFGAIGGMLLMITLLMDLNYLHVINFIDSQD